MSDFGDKDVLDAWDDGDDIEVKLYILERSVETLHATFHTTRRDDALRLVDKLQHPPVADPRPTRDQLRRLLIIRLALGALR